MRKIEIQDGMDAVFLPGKIHGCDWQAYIIYLNEQANDGSCRECGSAWSTQENDGEESVPQRYFFG